MAKGESSPCLNFIHKTLGEDLIGAEIGTWDRGNAEAVLDHIKPRLYFMIDPYRVWEGTSKSQEEFDSTFIKMFNKFRYYRNVKIIRKTSYHAVHDLPNNLDFVYINGAHDFENKILDIRTWYPKIRRGGILCGDDYNLLDVQKAVKLFTKENNLIFEFSLNCDPHPPEFWMVKP